MQEVFILKLDKLFEDIVKFQSGIELIIDTRLDREEKTNPIATIKYCPNNNSLGLKPGDIVFVGYGVVADGDTLEHGYTFQNRIHIDGEELWTCGDYDILAKVNGDDLVSLGDKIICKPTYAMGGWSGGSILINPNSELHKANFEQLEVLDAPSKTGFEKGQIIVVDARYSQLYKKTKGIDNEIVFIEKQYVLGIKDK